MSPRSKIARAALWLASIAILAGCNPGPRPMNTMEPKSDLAVWINNLFLQITAWDTLVLATVIVAFCLAVFIFSTRFGEAGPPSTAASDLRLEVAYTLGPSFIILMIAIPTIRLIFRSQPAVPPEGSLIVNLYAHQWWWEFRYPDSGVTTANELHIPSGRSIRMHLRSVDVIHSFWVPELGGKRDVVPGQTNELTFVANVPGEYLGQCAEFCGLSHANMRFRVFVDSPDQFAKWVADQKTGPPPIASNEKAILEGAKIYSNSPCTTCHTVEGISKGYIGPNLTHLGSRETIAAGVLQNNPHNLAQWITDPDSLKPGAEMPPLGLRGEALSELVAYLESLK